MQKELVYIPLFVHHADPITVYIIDNHIISFGEFWLDDFLPYRSYMCLYELFTAELSREAFPKQFHKYFLNEPSFIFEHPCLAGNVGDAWNNCLRLNLTFNENISPSIQLEDFTITQDTDCRLISKEIDHIVQLSAKDSFILFSNICATAAYNRVRFLFETKDGFDYKLVTQLLEAEDFDYFNLKKNKYDLSLNSMYQYILYYLEYIRELLVQQKITPAKILAHSGAGVLAILANVGVVQEYIDTIINELENNYSNISSTEKIVYYSLFVLIQHFTPKQYSEILKKYSKVEDLLTKVYSENTTFSYY